MLRHPHIVFFSLFLLLMQVPSSVLSPREVINREDEDIARAISMSLEVLIHIASAKYLPMLVMSHRA